MTGCTATSSDFAALEDDGPEDDGRDDGGVEDDGMEIVQFLIVAPKSGRVGNRKCARSGKSDLPILHAVKPYDRRDIVIYVTVSTAWLNN
jgi:hypothetical protein